MICLFLPIYLVFSNGAVLKNPPTNAKDARHVGLIFRLGRSPREGNGNPLQYSCLGNPMDRVAWWLQSIGLQRSQHDLATKQQQQQGLRKTFCPCWSTRECQRHRELILSMSINLGQVILPIYTVVRPGHLKPQDRQRMSAWSIYLTWWEMIFMFLFLNKFHVLGDRK